MNPRQRRGVLLMVLAAIGAVAVFIAVVGYVSDVRNQYGATQTVLQVTTEVNPYTPIPQNGVKEVQIPTRYAADAQKHSLFLTSRSQLDHKVAAAPIPKGAYLSQGMLMDKPATQEGEQQISIMVDAETGVAGQVHSGSHVDVYATYDSDQTRSDSCALRILSNVPVLEIGNLTPTKDASGGTTNSVPVTFALNAASTLKLSAAESFAQKVRLALRNPGDDSTSSGGNKSCIKQITRSSK